MDRIVNVGIIGCGGIANGKHMPSLKSVPNVSVVPEILEAIYASSKTGKAVYFE